ncbi:cytochrome bc complex cytochrome b subunit [Amycolatopsis sp. NPDC005232]|uniref:cytochrome bc1 complex cytochrome b subunit n=1 Tax=Amycolatopsis sp. NPDC005232 TaxID=3157027 RepID=UPI0033B80CFF
MSSLTTPTMGTGVLAKRLGQAADNADQRYKLAKGLRHQMNKVFPTHWSYLIGEVSLYSFLVVIATGVYLTLFFDPSMQEVTYHGSFTNLQGVEMSQAFKTTLDLSFDVRGGLFVRQLHHWGALIFIAATLLHMLRIFFTGAFRKPREANWVIGVLLLVISMFEGFFGYSLPDDLLSGTGVRATLSGIVLSVPVIGTWIHWALFGGEFPGDQIIPRLYTLHILLLPGILFALIGVHLVLVWFQKHTQFPGVRAKEDNVVGIRIVPEFALHGGSLAVAVTGVLALMAGLFQINPVWNFGPYNPSMVSAGSQPDWYMAWADGMLRIWPAWELYLGNYTIPAVFFSGAMGMGLLITLLTVYPWIESKLTKDKVQHHNLLQRPRDAPVRTSLGMMALGFFAVIELSGFNDIISDQFHISLNASTWAGRIGVLIVPPIAYYVTYRICLGLQRADREVLEHGVETGIIKRLPTGGFIEIHQPLAGVDSHGHPVPLDYQGAPVPKKMNKLGAAGRAVPGSLWTPDPPEETAALDRAVEQGNTL